MVIKQYVARKHSHLSNKDAELIGSFIDKKFGDGVTPEEFVEAARPARSPVHGYIEWDAGEGLRQWQLQQARQCINSVMVVMVDDEGRESETRAYEVVVLDEEQKYVSVPRVIWSNPALDQQVRARLIAKLQGIKRQLDTYQELSDAAEMIGQAMELIAA